MIVPDEQKRKALEKLALMRGYMGLNIFSITAFQTAYEQGDPWLEELLEVLICKYGLCGRTTDQN